MTILQEKIGLSTRHKTSLTLPLLWVHCTLASWRLTTKTVERMVFGSSPCHPAKKTDGEDPAPLSETVGQTGGRGWIKITEELFKMFVAITGKR